MLNYLQVHKLGSQTFKKQTIAQNSDCLSNNKTHVNP